MSQKIKPVDACALLQLISQVVNARVAVTRLGEFLAAEVQPELPPLPAAPAGAAPVPQDLGLRDLGL